MNSLELKQKYLEFFEARGHKRIANSSVIPENDPSALFINSGMHPIVRYLMGEPHPFGKRLVNYQRAVRTGDLENVGVTRRHHTFFEMMGNWSLGDYWKKESLEWSVEFIVDVLGFDPKRLYGTVFKGNENIPKDEEAIEIWKAIFQKYDIKPTVGDEFLMQDSPRIIMLGEEDNLWQVGPIGPCGPSSEIYYDSGSGEDTDTRFLEICNNVFMSYNRHEDGSVEKLPQQNIDVGWGFERVLSLVQNIDEKGDIPAYASNYDTDLFITERDWLLRQYKLELTSYENDFEVRRGIRVILDHIRASLILIGDGIEPSNKDQGYILRRLIRRATTFGWKFEKEENKKILMEMAEMSLERLARDEEYKFLLNEKQDMLNILKAEIDKFEGVLKNGIKELSKVEGNIVSGEIAFRLKESLGLPLEVTSEIALGQGKKVDTETYDKLMDEHQAKSRAGGEKKFVGGLADYSPESVRYHTCAHLFLAGSKKVLGSEIQQKGQNITSERLRYDINYDSAIPADKLQEIENWVNGQIESDLKVDFIETTLDEAKSYGVAGVFDDKYSTLETVKIYRIYPQNIDVDEKTLNPKDKDKFVSLEFCGGPHVEFTSQISELGKFKIVKEEASSSGVRRIKAVLIKN
jgi:alanyl-tRNA synthetase